MQKNIEDYEIIKLKYNKVCLKIVREKLINFLNEDNRYVMIFDQKEENGVF